MPVLIQPLTARKFIPAIVWFFFVLVILFLPGEDLPPVDNWLHKMFIDKWIHVGIFALMAFLFMRPVGLTNFPITRKTSIFVKIGVVICLWGLTTEFIQKYLVTGRSFDLFDWAADSIGSFLAVIFSRRFFLK